MFQPCRGFAQNALRRDPDLQLFLLDDDDDDFLFFVDSTCHQISVARVGCLWDFLSQCNSLVTKPGGEDCHFAQRDSPVYSGLLCKDTLGFLRHEFPHLSGQLVVDPRPPPPCRQWLLLQYVASSWYPLWQS